MKATNWDLMKLAQAFDGEFCLSDFSPEELDEMLGLIDPSMTPEQIREKYFEYYDDIESHTNKIIDW